MNRLGEAFAVIVVGASVRVRVVDSSQLAATLGSDYSALGDSIPFGYRESAPSRPRTNPTPAALSAYPEYVGQALDLHVTNASGPSETTASLVDAVSNGCEQAVVRPWYQHRRLPAESG